MNEIKRGHVPGVVGTCLVMMTAISSLYVLSSAASVAVPFMFALILAMLLSPMMSFGVRHGVPVPLMAIAVMVMLIAFLFPLGLLINSRIHSIASLMPEYIEKLAEIGRDVMARAADFLPFSSIDLMISEMDWYTPLRTYLTGVTGMMVNTLSRMTITLIFLFFMLLEIPFAQARMRSVAVRWDGGDKAVVIGGKVVRNISKYLCTLTVISFITGVLAFASLEMIGVDFAVTWGMLAFVLNFIPTIGSIIASIPPVMIALVQFYPNWVPAILAASLLLVIQFTIGNIITPKIMGDALDLTPIVILISLLCWGMIWGIPGAFLSVPITVMLKIVCEELEPLNFIADLISSSKRHG